MNIYTLNVGQGQFVIVAGAREAFIIDTHIPLDPAVPVVNVKGALAEALNGKNLIGLLVTGFDNDHFNEVGLKLVLHKYRPNWIAYPKYFKETQCASNCFRHLALFDRANTIRRISFVLGDNTRRFFNDLSAEFTYEMFSPHAEDMNSSNNCSLVCKVHERATGRSYLITGDTELLRWNSISMIFGSALKCDVLAAAHHGSKNGVSNVMLQFMRPHTVLISAGVNNHYGHPDPEALALYRMVAPGNVWCTRYGNNGRGQSLRTEATTGTIATYSFNP